LRFDVFTLFPDVFEPYLQTSILQRARQRGLVEVNRHNIRDWATDRHHVTDDEPYGGGGGMVMKPEPIFAAVEGVLGAPPACPVILLTPQGRLFTQEVAMQLAAPLLGHPALAEGEGLQSSDMPALRLALLCGRYEGVDERVRLHLVTDEISIGDFVLTGGELPALVVIDGLLEYPHYTRPPEFRGWRVPEVLVSGDHARLARWRREQSLLRTRQRRPDLLANASLSESDRKFLRKLEEGELKQEDEDAPSSS
jgi:tRNA (guanine37-N1)-methyltransferase